MNAMRTVHVMANPYSMHLEFERTFLIKELPADFKIAQGFVSPSFCLAEVTQEEFIAGGYLAGKSYADIEKFLKMYHYRPIIL